MSEVTAHRLLNGHDDFGPIEVKAANCEKCGELGVCVRYKKKPDLRDVDETSPSVILNPRRRILGVTCGCYARLHRQIVHITGKKEE